MSHPTRDKRTNLPGGALQTTFHLEGKDICIADFRFANFQLLGLQPSQPQPLPPITTAAPAPQHRKTRSKKDTTANSGSRDDSAQPNPLPQPSAPLPAAVVNKDDNPFITGTGGASEAGPSSQPGDDLSGVADVAARLQAVAIRSELCPRAGPYSPS